MYKKLKKKSLFRIKLNNNFDTEHKYLDMINLLITVTLGLFAGTSEGTTHKSTVQNAEVLSTEEPKVGQFTAEGKTIEVKFVRVLFAAEGSEKEGESNDLTPLLFDSVDPSGKPVKVRRFQIVAKNTGYDDLQTSKDADFKMKKVTEGVKLHIEVPVEKGQLMLDKAYVGNLAYNFGTKETRNALVADDVNNIQLKFKKLVLPTFPASAKPGDKGIVYHDGEIELELSSKAKNISSDKVDDFKVLIKGEISIAHIRGKERAHLAVNIDPAIVAKNK
jgi:hypothetical protein